MKLLNAVRDYACVPVSAGLMAVASFPVLAAETGTVVGPGDYAPIIEAMTGQITVESVVGVIASAILAGIGLVFMWWAGRKAVGTLMAAFRKGKVSM